MNYVGMIVGFEEYQVKRDGKSQFLPSGEPEMTTRIELDNCAIRPERCDFWADTQPVIATIAKAVKGAGATDLELGGYLAVTPVDGGCEVAYARPDSICQLSEGR